MFQPPSDYHFITHWRTEGEIHDVYHTLSEPLHYPDWWKGPQLRVTEIEPADEGGLNQIVQFEIKGWLPYTLRWQFKGTEFNPPHGFTSQASGDLVGSGVWLLKQDSRWVDITFDWNVRAEKPLLRRCSFFLRPIFALNHDWVMAKLKEGLRLELARLKGRKR